jgi:hypothetical protein
MMVKVFLTLKNSDSAKLMPIILATWEAEIGRIVVPGWPREKVCEVPLPRISTEKR